MGYWEQDSTGHSFTGDGHTLWGDHPADIMADAVHQIAAAFTEHIGRPPTVGEIKSGLLFHLSFISGEDDALVTEENMNNAWTRYDDPNADVPALAKLERDWQEHCKGTCS